MELCIVSSHFKENLSWLKNSHFPVYVVSKNKEESFDSSMFYKVHHIPNRGSEFGSYLWFICNYWNELPEKIAFVHGHEKSHHQSCSIFDSIINFKNFEFHGLNGSRTISYHYFFNEIIHPWFNQPLETWNSLGLNKICIMPRQFVFEGGTQTIVSRNLIKSNPLIFYEKILDFIMSLSFEHSYFISVFLEVVWHTILRQNPINFEIFDFNLNEYCTDNRIPILLMGPESIWHSKMKSSIHFGNFNFSNDEEWKKMCFNFFNMQFENNT